MADRQNNRIQVFDQDGGFIVAWRQFGQPSSVFVDSRDNIYVGSTYQIASERESPAGPNNRAIVVGDAITGELRYLIPDPGDLGRMTDTGTSASGIAVDDAGKHLRGGRRIQQLAEVSQGPVDHTQGAG